MTLLLGILIIIGIGVAVALAPMPKALKVTLIVIACVIGALIVITLLGGIDTGPRVHIWRD